MGFPVFAPGDILTAADMNAVGMWLVKKQTIGNAVSSVNVTSAFSANYENYRIVVSGGSGSAATAGLNMTLGATVAGYYTGQQQNTWASVGSATGAVNTSSWSGIGLSTTNILHMDICVYMPFAADQTLMAGFGILGNTTGYIRFNGGYLDNTTSYTDFTLTPSSGTITGGTIYVYGFR